jgi:hypothetical protein
MFRFIEANIAGSRFIPVVSVAPWRWCNGLRGAKHRIV